MIFSFLSRQPPAEDRHIKGIDSQATVEVDCLFSSLFDLGVRMPYANVSRVCDATYAGNPGLFWAKNLSSREQTTRVFLDRNHSLACRQFHVL